MIHRKIKLLLVAVAGILLASCTPNITEPYESESESNPPTDAELTADFSYNANNLSVKFTDKSSDADDEIVNWEWVFEDGGSSYEQHPTHDFSSPGNYDVTLTATNEDGETDTITKTVTVSEGSNSGPEKPEVTSNTCSADGGAIDIFVDGGVDGFGLKNLDTGNIIQSGDNISEDEFSFTDLMDADYRFTAQKNGQQSSVEFTVDCGSTLSNWKTHEVNFGFDDTIWISDHQNRLRDDLLTYGEVRPILTDAEAVGTVEVEIRFKLDADQDGTENFILEISHNSDGSNAFQTPLYMDQPDADGWVTATTVVDADHFQSKEKASVEVVHGDEINSDAPSGPDDIYFTDNDKDGKLLFHWRTETSSKTKISSQADNWTTTVKNGQTETEVTN